MTVTGSICLLVTSERQKINTLKGNNTLNLEIMTKTKSKDILRNPETLVYKRTLNTFFYLLWIIDSHSVYLPWYKDISIRRSVWFSSQIHFFTQFASR